MLNNVVRIIDKSIQQKTVENGMLSAAFIRNTFLWTIALRIVKRQAMEVREQLKTKQLEGIETVDSTYRNQFLRGDISIIAKKYTSKLNEVRNIGMEQVNQSRLSPPANPEVEARIYSACLRMANDNNLNYMAMTGEFWTVQDWFSIYGYTYLFAQDDSSIISSFDTVEINKLLAYGTVIEPAVESFITDYENIANYSYSELENDLKRLKRILKRSDLNVGNYLTLLREDIFFANE